MSKEKEVLFDKESPQTVPMVLIEDGLRYEVEHTFAPLTDEALTAFDSQRKLSLVPASDEVGASDTESGNPDAETEFWATQIISVGGYGDPEAELPADWQTQVPDGDKEEAVKLLLAAEVVASPAPKKAKWRAFGVRKSASGIGVRCYFSGYEVNTQHFLREATAADMAEWKRLTARLRLKQSQRIGVGATEIPAQMAAKAKLYDALVTSCTGYIGQPPLHHKALVVNQYFSRLAQVQEKN